MAKGLTKGLMVCKYAFKRVPGQADLIKRIAPDGAVLQMPKHEQVVDGHE